MNLIIASIIYEQGLGSLESSQISWKPFLKNTKIGQRLIGAMRPPVLLSWLICSISSYLRKFQGNPIVNSSPQPLTLLERGGGAESARTIFKRPFLHEKRVQEVPNFVTFPNPLWTFRKSKKTLFFSVFWGDLEGAGWFSLPALKQHPEAPP